MFRTTKSDRVFQELSKYLWDYYNSGTPGVWSPRKASSSFLQQKCNNGSVVSPAIFHTFAWSLGDEFPSSHQPGEALGRKLNHSKLLEKKYCAIGRFATFTAIQPKESYGNLQHDKNTCGSFYYVDQNGWENKKRCESSQFIIGILSNEPMIMSFFE